MFVLYVYGNEAIVMWDVLKWERYSVMKHDFLQLTLAPVMHYVTLVWPHAKRFAMVTIMLVRCLFQGENSQSPKETSESAMIVYISN